MLALKEKIFNNAYVKATVYMIVGMGLSLGFMAVMFTSWINEPDQTQYFHEQYLSGQSHLIMQKMAEDEKEAKLKEEFGLGWMNVNHK